MINILSPGSKSYIQRALIIGACCYGTSRIKNINLCDDVISTINLLRQLRSEIEIDEENNIVIIKKPIDFSITDGSLFIGESGTLCRIIIPIICECFCGRFEISGEKTIMNRIIEDPILDIFRNNGIEIFTSNGKLPIIIDTTNRKKFSRYELYILDGSNTSQYISGFIISRVYNSKRNKRSTFIEITNCNSIGYVNITLDVLKMFKQNLHIKDNIIKIEGRIRLVSNYNCEMPGDWSSAAALYTASYIFNKEISISNVNNNSLQPDKNILNILHDIKNNHIEFGFDISKCPDIFPYVAVAAAVSKQEIRIDGIHVLTNKESNRVQAIHDEFNNLGICCKIENDSFIVNNNNVDYNKLDNKINTYNDHRIAMALIMIKVYYNKPYEYDPCLNKSYPNFIEDLKTIIEYEQ